MSQPVSNQGDAWEDEYWQKWANQVEMLGYASAKAAFRRHWSDPQLHWEFARRFNPEVRAMTVQPSEVPPLTPYELGVLLHYYGHTDDHKAFRETEQSKDRLVRIWRLLEQIPPTVLDARQRTYRITARGSAYVDSLLRVPLPEAVWVTTWPTK